MLTTLRHPRALVAAILWTASAGLLALLSAPCLADVAPESGLLMHVWGDTLITDCHEIVRTTSAEGSVTFMLFFMRGAFSWPGQTICMQSLRSVLAWPETWQLLDFWALGNDDYASLDPDGPTHALHIEWNYFPYEISDEPQGIVPVAVLVMDVTGPGLLGFAGWHGEAGLRHDCSGTPFVSYPVQVGAEAGIQCGYISPHCGYWDDACQAVFDVPELLLTAQAGAEVDSTVDFWAYYHGAVEYPCPLEVDTHAPWCTAWIDPEYDYREAHLHVTASAAGLEPGLYETEIELYNAYWGAARCLPVDFAVEEASASVDENPPATPKVTWGWIKALYR
jgi:hypothetical protein